ncbi:MAG TPA: MerR family transcriptional regulator [Allosphingosinicella sp.]|nr:MerR family transcriptional regulator [Allosphingosinicella sp.]
MTLTLRQAVEAESEVEEPMRELTVKQLARTSGVSVRTLHHYDGIGLLKPAHIGTNGYRYYGRGEMLRLQQILFFREFGLALKDVAMLLERPREEQIVLLAEQRDRIAAEAKRKRELVRTIDRAIQEYRGGRTMKNAEIYRGFDPEKQREHEEWLAGRYGAAMEAGIARSKAHLAAAPPAGAMQELHDAEQALAAQMREGARPGDAALRPLVERHRDWVASMWGRDCTPEAHVGLAGLYEAHPEFRRRYESIAPGFTDWLAAAIRAAA